MSLKSGYIESDSDSGSHFSGEPAQRPSLLAGYERVTAAFGITAFVAVVVSLFGANSAVFQTITPYLLQVGGFCIITLLSIGYERTLPFARPLE